MIFCKLLTRLRFPACRKLTDVEHADFKKFETKLEDPFAPQAVCSYLIELIKSNLSSAYFGEHPGSLCVCASQKELVGCQAGFANMTGSGFG